MEWLNYFRNNDNDLKELKYIKSDKSRAYIRELLENWQLSDQISKEEFRTLYSNHYVTVKENTGTKITMFPFLFWINASLSSLQLCLFGSFLLVLLTQDHKTLGIYCVAACTASLIILTKVQIYKTMVRPIQILMKKYYFPDRYNNFDHNGSI